MLHTQTRSKSSSDTRSINNSHSIRIVHPIHPDNRSPALSVEIWRDPGDFQALAMAWNTLAERADPDNVFLRHEWFTAAWQWLRTETELRLLGFRWDDNLVGIVPLVHRKTRGKRVLSFMTVPDTQSCALIVPADALLPVTLALAATLRTQLTDWDELQLSHLDHTSPAVQALHSAFAHHGFRTMQRAQGNNPCVRLDGGWEAYYARRSRRLKKGNNLIANILARQVQRVELHQIGADQPLDDQAMAQLLDTVKKLSSNSWKRTTGLTLDQPGPQAFIRKLTAAANREGWLSVWLLSIDETAVAMEYQLRYRGQVHALRADYHADFAELSPGSYLNWKMLEQLFARDDRCYWMGPGNNAYKQRWAESGQSQITFVAFNTTLRGRWLALRESILRPLYHRLCALLSASKRETPP